MRTLTLTALIALPLWASWTAPRTDRTDSAVEPPFRLSESCQICHSNSAGARAMRDEANRPIAPFDLWQSSMMANSARDPLWRAAVSAEVAATPSQKVAIEAKCMRCHTPMAAVTADAADGPIGMALLDEDSRRAELARDGVSCTVCHSIDDVDLGEPKSFSGHFVVNQRGVLFGPHDDPFTRPMQMHTDLVPELGEHITQSALCATCHTLFTHTLDAAGNPTGANYPEQTPYLEWRNSAFADDSEELGLKAASCQDCHVPAVSVDGGILQTRIARNPMGGDFPVNARVPFGRHVFVGGNTLIPAILRDNREALGVKAPDAAFDATIAAARHQLRTRTAKLEFESIERSDDVLAIDVRVENLVGHKFPSAYPSRRAWLRVRVIDRDDAVRFDSGAFDDAGRIIGPDHKPLASEIAGGPIMPHHDTVAAADQVQIYEVVMSDAGGEPTYRLMRAAHNHKDNRLLPDGWNAAHPDAEHTAPVGVDDDENFAAATDRVTYEVLAPKTAGPFRIEAELLYQTLGARYAAELFEWRTPEVLTFERMYQAATRTPEFVASVTATAD